MQRRVIMFFAFLFVGVFCLIQGPSNLFDLNPHDPTYAKTVQKFRISGICLSGFFLSFLFFPILPEVLFIAHKKEGILDDYNLIDKASGIYGMFFSLGCILGVMVGDFFY